MLNDKIQHELIELERAMWSDKTRFDIAFQERHFSNDFIEFGRSGRVYDREKIIITDGHPINAALENIVLRELAHEVVLITYDSVLQNSHGTTEYSRRSSIWHAADGRWQMRFHQGTPFSPPA